MELQDRIEIAKLIASFLTPLVIAFVGLLIKRTLAEQNRRWEVQERLADKRVEVYEKVAEDLNTIYCYVEDVGDFKKETPDKILNAKRNVDKYMYVYQAIWPAETFTCFKEYMGAAFAMYQGGQGKDALIRARSSEKKEAHKNRGENWPDSWDNYFIEKRDPQHQSKYQELMKLISRDLMYLPPDTEERTPVRPWWSRFLTGT